MLGGLFESAMDAVCFSPTRIKVFGLGSDSVASHPLDLSNM